MDPVSLSLVAKAGSAAFSGISALSRAKAEREQAERNAFIGRTRAMQTDTTARQGLSSELANVRAVLSANGQRPGVSTFEITKDLRQTRNRERRISFGNEMNRVYDFEQSGRNAMSRGRAGFALGMLEAGPSLFDLYQYRST
tara:strand:+ start:52 stop:477 length:426 start_codon:yes stop_codon:yes gene_type:complete